MRGRLGSVQSHRESRCLELCLCFSEALDSQLHGGREGAGHRTLACPLTVAFLHFQREKNLSLWCSLSSLPYGFYYRKRLPAGPYLATRVNFISWKFTLAFLPDPKELQGDTIANQAKEGLAGASVPFCDSRPQSDR